MFLKTFTDLLAADPCTGTGSQLDGKCVGWWFYKIKPHIFVKIETWTFGRVAVPGQKRSKTGGDMYKLGLAANWRWINSTIQWIVKHLSNQSWNIAEVFNMNIKVYKKRRRLCSFHINIYTKQRFCVQSLLSCKSLKSSFKRLYINISYLHFILQES